MKFLKYIVVGVLFGIIMTKSEAISWYRIQEMFRFQSFHMYGIIGTALISGMLMVLFIKRTKLNTYDSKPIQFKDKNKSLYRYLLGGTVFGLGWALSGACPGPSYTLIGNGYFSYIVVLASAILGTYVYGLLRDKLPH